MDTKIRKEPHSSFRIRTYGWQELAVLYSPEVTPITASRRLKEWVELNKTLKEELTHTGWKKEKRNLTPIQVSLIIYYLGEP